MKTPREDDNREPVPLDMVIEILTKLPAKSLFRFRCVSKQWCSIIRSRPFIDSFMSLSLSRPRILLLGYDTYRGYAERLVFISLPLHAQDSNHLSVVSKYDVPFSEHYGFCNSVRGIFCVSLGNHSLICNPTTKQVITIPNDLTGFDHMHNICVMFLGYDTSNDQYKIMRTIRWVAQDKSHEHSVCTLRLGEQSSFSSWRRVESGNADYFIKTNALCISEVVYYGAQKKRSYSLVIVSFDVASERLLLMEAPEENNLVGMVNYQGKLACIFISNDDGSSLWILDDAKKQIWSKAGVFSSSFYDLYRNLNLIICGATNMGEIIFVSKLIDGALELYYYDLKKNNVSKRVRTGDIAEDELRRILMHIYSPYGGHVENLISL
ncbi:unnamed protein product [Microthlaspi erraticum]|uniref:F-box domain-containing protein n=1 Tax=Microthlaspi erraticum TaxID=1685480 RepID=A0A6D2J7E7_9BRAS|nr:unnamed protein product [Microthlaspi erraticum]